MNVWRMLAVCAMPAIAKETRTPSMIPVPKLLFRPTPNERVAALQPDLILTTAWQPLEPEQLRRIAPTVVQDYTKRSDWGD